MDEYRDDPGLNWSRLRLMATSPLAFRANVRRESAGFAMGTLVHTLVLEPELFDSRYAVWNGGRRAGKEFEAFRAENAGRDLIKAEELEQATRAAQAVFSHPVAGLLFVGGEAEVSLYWDEPLGNGHTRMKGRADYVIHSLDKVQAQALDLEPGARVLVDLKTTRDVDPDGFARACARYQYHGQFAHYARGLAEVHGQVAAVFAVAVQVEEPHDVGVYRMHEEDWLWQGEQLRERLLKRYHECRMLEEWPGACPRWQRLPVPRWVNEEREEG